MYFTADHGHRGHLKDRTAVPVRCSARFVHYTSVVISMHLHLLSDETLDSALIMVWGILVFFCGYYIVFGAQVVAVVCLAGAFLASFSKA